MAEENDYMLEMVNISKSFSGVSVLENVNFNLRKGEVHAIIGQNGAGKSVLMKILYGVYIKDSGSIKIENAEVNYKTTNEAKKLGIGMVFQEFSLIPTMTVAQNMFLTNEPKKFNFFVKDNEMIKSTKDILSNMGIYINPKDKVGKLPVGLKQIVEIGKAVFQEKKVIVMDEPTASLNNEEVKALNEVIRKLKEKGISIIYISHRLKEIFEICDRVTVLRDGKNILTEDTNKLKMESLIEAILGKKSGTSLDINFKKINRNEVPRLEVKNLDLGGKEKISFKLWPGEVLGIAGLLGAGQTNIVQSIYGVSEKKYEKELFINGKKVNIKSPSESIKHKITMVPEERQVQGLVVEQSIKQNICMSIFDTLKGLFFINNKKIENIANKYVDELSIKTESILKKVKFLSGGNQQKVVISKNLAVKPDIVILNDPSFGVDIKSKQEILKIVSRLADEGKSVIFISSELEELTMICDRVLIIKNGSVINEFIRDEEVDLTEELLLNSIQ